MATEVQLTAAMRANLVSLQTTSQLIGVSQQRLSTGKKVNSALDNPASFFAAREHTQRADLLTGLKDNIGEAINTVKAADQGVSSISALIESLRGTLTQARTALTSTTSATDLGTAVSGYNNLIAQLNGLASDASYNGTNLVSGTGGATPNVSLKVFFNEQRSNFLVISGFDGSASGLGLSGGSVAAGAVGTLVVANLATTAGIDATETALNTALATLRQDSSQLAGSLSVLSTRQDFITNITNTLKDGATALTAADQNEEGAKLLTLQTQLSLGTTSLSLASQAQASVLRLF
jgi:flagellin-like hook-associated protein FlgL